MFRADRIVPLLALFLAGGAFACATFDATTDPARGLPDVIVEHPSFEANIQPIFTRRCSIGGCHSLAEHQADLVLAPGHAYDSLVNVNARLTQSSFKRVKPGDAANSWLVRMISPDPAGRDGLERMPLLSSPLTPNQIATIINWIDDGAPRN
jgi:hypothetical protein